MNINYINQFEEFKIVGMWEYNPIKDTIILSKNASNIYFYCDDKKEVNIRDMFTRLTPISCRRFLQILTSETIGETVFSQQVYLENFSVKEVLVVAKKLNNIVVGMSIDIMEG